MNLAERRRGQTSVYQPAEDSSLLKDAFEATVARDDSVLEVGVGSGWVLEQIQPVAGRVVGCDVNPHACRATAKLGIEVIRGDLMDAVQRDTFDVVGFNPPYLPADDRTSETDWMGRAITGGETGREVIRPFLADLERVLTSDGVAVLVVSSLTDVEAVRSIGNEYGFRSTIMHEEAHPFETLVTLKFV